MPFDIYAAISAWVRAEATRGAAAPEPSPAPAQIPATPTTHDPEEARKAADDIESAHAGGRWPRRLILLIASAIRRMR